MTQRTATALPPRQPVDPSFIDDYHATQNLDYAIRHGRRADYMPPPWAAQMQAEADRAATAPTARDITRGVIEEIVGPHTQTHRKATA